MADPGIFSMLFFSLWVGGWVGGGGGAATGTHRQTGQTARDVYPLLTGTRQPLHRVVSSRGQPAADFIYMPATVGLYVKFSPTTQAHPDRRLLTWTWDCP